MTITYTTEAGTELTAPSEEALERGWDWYNSPQTTKAEMIEFCAAHGVDIMEAPRTLVDDWAEIAAYTYANNLPGAK